MDVLPHAARAQAENALIAWEEVCRPGPPEAIAVAIVQLLDWIELFGVVPLPNDPAQRAQRKAALSAAYRTALQDLPGDLALRAVEEVIATHRYALLPNPADLRAAVAGDVARRQLMKGRLQAALRFGRFAPPPLRPEDRIRPGQMAALGRGILASAIARMPGAETAEDSESPAVSERRRLALDAERVA